MSVDSFLDANILIYAVSNAPDEAVKKQRALQLILNENFGISAQVLQEFYVAVTRKFKQPIPHPDAVKFIRALVAFPLITTDFGPHSTRG